MNRFLLAVLIATCFATPIQAKDAAYRGGVHVVEGTNASGMARGVVFDDENRNSIWDAGEPGIADVIVSNGRETILTGGEGRYELPSYDDMNLFITKPAGYAVPVDNYLVPQFSYVHKVVGSPPLRYGGIAPTGSLPAAINFPLIRDNVGDDFSCLVFGDTQPYTNREVSYVRDTLGKMLVTRDLTDVECLIFEGDVMGDDLSLFPRFKQIIAQGGVPQYYVAGNHDVDFDAAHDDHSFDTFRREWGPEYYSFDIGKVHFVVLDNVRYPCNGVDPHPFCATDRRTTYNGVISPRQIEWLKNDLALVPKDRLIVVNAHIPFVSFADADNAKSQTDNLSELYALLDGRPALGLSGHTHAVEQVLPGEHYEGWLENTGTGPAPFHQIVTGAVSGSWWTGDNNHDGIPHATGRFGAPRGFYELSFKGADYRDTFIAFGQDDTDQLHAGFNTPRFRAWAEKLYAFAEASRPPWTEHPPVTVNDLGDPNMISRADLEAGTWVMVNVWNGSKASAVQVSINDGPPVEAKRTQDGDGEASRTGPDFSDPVVVARQSTNGRMAFRSTEGGDETAGFTSWTGFSWAGKPGPLMPWMMAARSPHLWRLDLPRDLPAGFHTMRVTTTDRYGRRFKHLQTFEIVEELPNMGWDNETR